MKKRLRASIDIGTNTVLLLVAEQHKTELKPVFEQQLVPRLGKGVDSNKTLAYDSMMRVIAALSEYKKLLELEFPEVETPIVTATSAARDAKNKSLFLRLVRDYTDWKVCLLSGKMEAEWTYAGALSTLEWKKLKKYVVLDIGGGSSEVAFGKGANLLTQHSFDMGSVRFTERYLADSPPSQQQIAKVKEQIKSTFESYTFDLAINEADEVIGVAGTLTSAAFMIAGLQEYQPEKLNGMSLEKAQIDKLIAELSLLSVDELLAAQPIILKGRADIFLAGLLILQGFMEFFNFETIRVSTGGIRHGALLKTF